MAADLQERIQELDRPWHRLRKNGIRVFRDDAEFSTGAKAWQHTESALLDSDWLVLLVQLGGDTPWARMELDWWLKNRGAERIIVVLLDNDPALDSRTGTFFEHILATVWPDSSPKFLPPGPWIDLRPGFGIAAGLPWESRLEAAAASIAAQVRDAATRARC